MDFSFAASRFYLWLVDLLPGLGGAVVVLALGWFLSRYASRLIRLALGRVSNIDRNFAPLLAQAARYSIMVFAVVTALSFLGVPSATILGALAAAGLAIALALQNTLANIAAGIMLVWLRPIAIGEYIVGNGVAGVVIEIGLFATRLRSTSGLYVFTPNQALWSAAITNHSREPSRRVDVNVSVPDKTDIEAARRAMLGVANVDRRVQSRPAATVHVDAFAGDRIFLQLRAWVATPDYLDALRDLTEASKNAVNAMLTAGEKAEVGVATDPHTLLQGQAPREPS